MASATSLIVLFLITTPGIALWGTDAFVDRRVGLNKVLALQLIGMVLTMYLAPTLSLFCLVRMAKHGENLLAYVDGGIWVAVASCLLGGMIAKQIARRF